MEGRTLILNNTNHKKNVLYLMNRDQRIHQNYSVELGYNLSYETKSELYIGFDLNNIKMNKRQKYFIFQGLSELDIECEKFNLHLFIINDVKSFVFKNSIDCIILDFSPLKELKQRDKELTEFCKDNNICLILCDSHNIVPCWLLETYKRTPKAVRTDLYKLYDKYLKAFKSLESHKYNHFTEQSKTSKKEIKDYETLEKELFNCKYSKIRDLDIFKDDLINNKVAQQLEVSKKKGACLENHHFEGGYKKGFEMMKEFFNLRFKIYDKERNNPDIFALSNLSPWLHTGQISAQEVILVAKNEYKHISAEGYESLVNELFIWREIADHFVYHEPNYDNINGALGWAKETLLTHSKDNRKKVYSKNDFERSRTADKLWNAAQNELLYGGKIHGYIRMYWAKRILEWSKSPEEALEIALFLNDEYSYDGNDPSGYLGVMWSICGSMDRAFMERDIFGKIRFMAVVKCPLYISKWTLPKLI